MERPHATAAVLCLAVVLAFSCLALAETGTTTQKAQSAAAAAPAEETKAEKESNPLVIFETSKGKITIELYPEEAPVTVENFLRYVNEGFYDGTIFHRVIPRFVIQGGGFTADMQRKKTHAPIKNEAANGLKNLRGTLSMARTNDPNSATSQFFINLVDNKALDKSDKSAGYAVFGKVTRGMDIVDAIAKVPTTTKGSYKDVPKTPVTIVKAYVKAETETAEKKAVEGGTSAATGKKADKKVKEQKAKDN